MRDHGSGKIINISSMGGKIYTPFGAWYHASKHALEGWSDCLRYELKPFGIDVIIIEPGTINTPWNSRMRENLKQFSGDGPYKKLVLKMLSRSEKASESKEGSPPEVIAKLISEAVNSEDPKTRYAGGKYAKLLIFIRTKLGDKIFDQVMRRMIE